MDAPLVPPDCDLRDARFMPLEVERLRRSKAWLIAKRRPELGFYMMNLWMVSWHEVPTGSLEDDDDVLAHAAMCDPAKWEKVRATVLRGWIKGSDGRLYHPVVAEKARACWGERQAYRNRAAAAREAKRQKRDSLSLSSMTGPVTEPDTDPMTEPVTGLTTALKVKVGVKEDSDSSGLANAKPTESSAANGAAVDLKAAVFGPGLQWLSSASGKSSDRLRSLLGQWCRDHGDAAVMEALQAAQREKPLEPVAWIAAHFAAQQKRKVANSGYIPMHPGAGGD